VFSCISGYSNTPHDVAVYTRLSIQSSSANGAATAIPFSSQTSGTAQISVGKCISCAVSVKSANTRKTTLFAGQAPASDARRHKPVVVLLNVAHHMICVDGNHAHA